MGDAYMVDIVDAIRAQSDRIGDIDFLLQMSDVVQHAHTSSDSTIKGRAGPDGLSRNVERCTWRHVTGKAGPEIAVSERLDRITLDYQIDLLF